MQALPGHTGSEVEHCINRVEQRAVPVIFENAPTPFDWIVFTVIRRIIGQPHPDAILPYKLDQSLHKLRTPTMVFRPVIEIDHQCGDMPKAMSYGFPPLH